MLSVLFAATTEPGWSEVCFVVAAILGLLSTLVAVFPGKIKLLSAGALGWAAVTLLALGLFLA